MARYIPPAVWAMPQVLCLILGPLALASIIVGAIWLCTRHYILPAATAIVIIAIWPALSDISPINFPDKPAPDAPTLKLLTYNVHIGTDMDGNTTPGSGAMDYVIFSGADIVCMQELYNVGSALTHGDATKAQVAKLRELYPYSVNKGDLDATIISKYPLTKIYSEYCPSLRYFMYEAVKVDIPGHPLTLVNVHLTSFGLSDPERDVVTDAAKGHIKSSAKAIKRSVYAKLTEAFRQRAEAAQMLAKFVKTLEGDVIICGDFNDVPASYAYQTVKNAGLKDAYQEAGLGPMITFNGHNLFFHIDQVLYKGGLQPYAVTRGKTRASDHYPLSIDFEFIK